MAGTYIQFRSFVQNMRRVPAGALLLAALTAGCSRDTANARAGDSALDRDLTLAGATSGPPPAIPTGDTATSARRSPDPTGRPANRAESKAPPAKAPTRAQVPTQRAPQPVETPVVPAPPVAAPTAALPAPTPAATVPAASPIATKTIGAGTALVATTTSQLCSLANRPGDKIVANLISEVTGPDGARLPVGTPVLIEMAAAEPPADFAFRVRGVQVNGQLIPVEGRVSAEGETNDRRVSKGGDKGKVATGAVIGAILGRVIGGGVRGTVIGAAGGAAGGSIMAARNSTVEHCLPSGARITVTLTTPLIYPTSSP